jgi:alpha-galactosidase
MTRMATIGDGNAALALALPERGMPEIVAFGAEAAEARWVTERARRVNGMREAVPATVLLPTGGMGFFGWPAIAGHRDGRDFVIEFSDWTVDAEATRSILRGVDALARLAIEIRLSLTDGALASSVTLTNHGETTFTLDRCLAGSMTFREGATTLTSFGGMWGREFRMRREPLGAGLWLAENRRGRTSHDRAPSLLLAAQDETLAVHLGWSGNHVLAVDALDDGRRLVHAGELFEPGEMRLGAGESYQSPTAYFAREPAALRARLRQMMVWPAAPPCPRPVTLNTWEASYFDVSLPTSLKQADAAAELGIERFVLDDGWFGIRDGETSGLGDWTVDTRKFPDGLKPLADRVHAHGMEFGLWFEPEMASPDSHVYRAHPEWALRVEGRPLLLSRHQVVLDLTRADVVDHLFEQMDAVLRETPIDYIKWDMNRDLTHAAGRDGRAVAARQTRAVYALMDKIRAAHPRLEIESCSSGGARADYGVLLRAHRIWASDGTDALERLETQRGARVMFPPEIIGAHVSTSPNHQTHRAHALSFRALVGIAYHFGVEMDPLSLTAQDREELKEWIALHKRLRPLLHDARAQFDLEPLDGRYVWGAAVADRIVAIVAQGPAMMAEQPPPFRLPGHLVAPGSWRIAACRPAEPDFIRTSEGQVRLLAGSPAFSRASLVAAGLPLPMLRPQSGFLLELERVTGA